MSNAVTLTGNLAVDPELRFTPNRTAVCDVTVAVNRSVRKQDGTWGDELDGFFKATCWKDMAENVAASLHKGDRVIVTGRLKQRSWDGKQDGTKHTAVEIADAEVGPSLKFARAQMSRSGRASN